MTDFDIADQHSATAARGTGSPQVHAFDLSKELERARESESWRQGKHSARTLLKTANLRLVLIAMHERDRIEEHRAPGPISIHTLRGHIRITVGNDAIDLPAGQVLTLEQAATHAIVAVAESAFLLTIAWPTATGARP